MSALTPNLKAVPETMLWTLHNRAREAMREGGIIKDPHAVRIYQSINYDYERFFGAPDGSHAIRSKVFDDELIPWIQNYPGGTIVNLGDGLETQALRLSGYEVDWVSVDVAEAIDIRERFIVPTKMRRHIRRSALDYRWMDEINAEHGLFITAQGLFMYFEAGEVRDLIGEIYRRFPMADLLFDTIPPWFSEQTLEGLQRTEFYTAPPMPWSVKASEVEALMFAWAPEIRDVKLVSYSPSLGFSGFLMRVAAQIPFLRDRTPCAVHLKGSV